jgi:16S rRNA (guanine966-N2)-methyltransferase
MSNYLSNIDNFDHKIDLIFLDPPFKEKNIFELINNIIEANILKKNGIIVIHRNEKSKDNYPNNFKILDIRKYGISKIIFGNLAF